MKKFFKKVGEVISNVCSWVAAIVIGASILGIPVVAFLLLLGGVLKLFGVM